MKVYAVMDGMFTVSLHQTEQGSFLAKQLLQSKLYKNIDDFFKNSNNSYRSSEFKNHFDTYRVEVTEVN